MLRSKLLASMFVTGLVFAGLPSVGLSQEGPRAVAADPVETRILEQFEEVQQLVAQGRGPEAMKLFESMRDRHGEHATFMAYEARMMLGRNQVPQAMEKIEAALAKQPHHPMATALKANVTFRQGKQAEASAMVNEALKANPNAWPLQQMVAEMQMATQQLPAAKQSWQKVINNPDTPAQIRMEAHAKLGQMAMVQEQFGEAADEFGKSLKLQWTPQVGMAHIQALDKAKRPVELHKAITEMRAALTNHPHPQIKGLLAQFNQQVAPMEARAKESQFDAQLAEIDAEMAKPDHNTYIITSRLNRMKTAVSALADANEKARLLKEIQLREMKQDDQLLRVGVGKNYSHSWRVNIANRVLDKAQGLDGAQVTNATAYAKDILEKAKEAMAAEAQAVVALTSENKYSLADLMYPKKGLQDQLKEKDLPLKYNEFSPETKTALEAYYKPLAEQRPKLEVEAAVAAWAASPADEAQRSKVVKLMVAHLQTFDAKDHDTLTSDKVIPPRVWLKPHNRGYSLDVDKEVNDRRELSYTMWNDLPSFDLKHNAKWDFLIQGLTRAIETYPRHAALIARAKAKIQMNDIAGARDDMALALAVMCFEEANSLGSISSNPYAVDWTAEGVQSTLLLNEIATGKLTTTGDHPSKPVADFLKHVKAKNWAAASDFFLKEYERSTLEYNLVREQLAGPQLAIYNALAERYKKADKETQQKILKSATYYYSDSQPGIALIRAESEIDLEKKARLLVSALSHDAHHVMVNYTLAQTLEEQDKKDEAMLQYNVAARGQLASQAQGQQRLAALARDRLSGPLTDLNAVVKLYLPHYNDLRKKAYVNYPARVDLLRLEAISMLFQTYKGQAQAILPLLSDVRGKLKDYPAAINDLVEAEKLLPDKKALYRYVMAEYYRELCEYDKALELYQQALAAGYDKAIAHSRQGDIHQYHGRYEEAVKSYTAALEMEPENTYALSQRSELYEYVFNDDEKALADGKKAFELVKKANPDGNHFTLQMRVNNLEMKIARAKLDKMFQ